MNAFDNKDEGDLSTNPTELPEVDEYAIDGAGEMNPENYEPGTSAQSHNDSDSDEETGGRADQGVNTSGSPDDETPAIDQFVKNCILSERFVRLSSIDGDALKLMSGRYRTVAETQPGEWAKATSWFIKTYQEHPVRRHTALAALMKREDVELFLPAIWALLAFDKEQIKDQFVPGEISMGELEEVMLRLRSTDWSTTDKNLVMGSYYFVMRRLESLIASLPDNEPGSDAGDVSESDSEHLKNIRATASRKTRAYIQSHAVKEVRKPEPRPGPSKSTPSSCQAKLGEVLKLRMESVEVEDDIDIGEWGEAYLLPEEVEAPLQSISNALLLGHIVSLTKANAALQSTVGSCKSHRGAHS